MQYFSGYSILIESLPPSLISPICTSPSLSSSSSDFVSSRDRVTFGLSHTTFDIGKPISPFLLPKPPAFKVRNVFWLCLLQLSTPSLFPVTHRENLPPSLPLSSVRGWTEGGGRGGGRSRIFFDWWQPPLVPVSSHISRVSWDFIPSDHSCETISLYSSMITTSYSFSHCKK